MNAVLPYLKAYAALVGSIATALLAVWAADSDVGHWLTVVGVIATTVLTWAVPNLDPNALHQDESVQPPTNEVGAIDAGTAMLIALFVVVILILLFVLPVGR